MKELFSQPKSINQLLDEGIKLFLIYFPKIWPLILATVVQAILVQLWMPPLNATDDLWVVVEAVMANLWYLFPHTLVLLVLQTAIFYRISCLMTSTEQGNGEALWQGLKYLLPLFLASSIYSFLVGIGLLIIVPGIIFAVSLCFFTPLILFEKVSVLEAFSRSHRLVWEHWWQTAIVLGLSILISSMAGVLLTIVVKNLLLVATTFSQKEIYFWIEITFVVSDKLLSPFLYVMLLLQYEELKRYQQRSQRFQTDLFA